jgi:hypothetical protein
MKSRQCVTGVVTRILLLGAKMRLASIFNMQVTSTYVSDYDLLFVSLRGRRPLTQRLNMEPLTQNWSVQLQSCSITVVSTASKT